MITENQTTILTFILKQRQSIYQLSQLLDTNKKFYLIKLWFIIVIEFFCYLLIVSLLICIVNSQFELIKEPPIQEISSTRFLPNYTTATFAIIFQITTILIILFFVCIIMLLRQCRRKLHKINSAKIEIDKMKTEIENTLSSLRIE